ncbi:hypothetical protein [Streptomyces somaliensis]|uniref:hypothetical protein n=1 Tax=Streptomyces somaliensis TaxID=78355 RepID=UPI0034E96CCF|nr:hypothetical protein [Streptomyces somaliensis]
MPSSWARRSSASGAERVSTSRRSACSWSVSSVVLRFSSASLKDPWLREVLRSRSPMSPPPRRTTTSRTKGVRAAVPGPDGMNRASRAARPFGASAFVTRPP